MQSCHRHAGVLGRPRRCAYSLRHGSVRLGAKDTQVHGLITTVMISPEECCFALDKRILLVSHWTYLLSSFFVAICDASAETR